MLNAESFFGADLHLNEQGVALFVDALKLDRTNRLPAELREHVAECQICRKNITGLFSLLAEEDYRKLGNHPFLDKAGRRRPLMTPYILRAAAIVIAVAGVALLSYYLGIFKKSGDALQSSGARPQILVDTSSRAHEQSQRTDPRGEALHAENFAVLPELEDLAGSEVRSAGFEVISPKKGAFVNRKIVFDWKGGSAKGVTLTLLDNKGKSLFTAQVKIVPFVVDKALPAGLYYWKIQNEEEMLYVGKFTIN